MRVWSCGVDVSGSSSGVSGGDVEGQIRAFRAQRIPVPYSSEDNNSVNRSIPACILILGAQPVLSLSFHIRTHT
jgi:hypothetical protein